MKISSQLQICELTLLDMILEDRCWDDRWKIMLALIALRKNAKGCMDEEPQTELKATYNPRPNIMGGNE